MEEEIKKPTTPETSETATEVNNSPKTENQKEQTKEAIAQDFNYKKFKNKEKEFESKYGKNPTKDSIVQKFSSSWETFKDKSYEDIMGVLHSGVKQADGKYDESLKNQDLHDWIKDNVNKGPEKKEEEIEKKKEELNKESATEESKEPETKEPEKKEKIEKTESANGKKRNFNPIKAGKHLFKRGLWLVSTPFQLAAKAAAVITRPQELLEKDFWKDLGTNIKKGIWSLPKVLTGLVYAPHRKPTEFVNMHKAYGKTRWPSGEKGVEGLLRSFGWTVGKIAKVPTHLAEGVLQTIRESLDSIRKGKADYSATGEAFTKALSRNYKGKTKK